MTQRTVLVTGASGLLGGALVDVFSQRGIGVVAQYFSNPLQNRRGCDWIQGDLSTIGGIALFLEQHKEAIRRCRYLVNNWGPLTYKDIRELTATDFVRDYFDNIVPAIEITRFLLAEGGLEAVVNIGFEFVGDMKPYKKILPYAAAKNALWLLTQSYAEAFSPVRFNMVSPPTITGAQLPSPNARRVLPVQVAEKVIRVMTGCENGLNFVI